MSLREIVIKRFLNLVEDGPKNKRDELVLSFWKSLKGFTKRAPCVVPRPMRRE